MSEYMQERNAYLRDLSNNAIIQDGMQSALMLKEEEAYDPTLSIDPAPIFHDVFNMPLHDPREVLLKKLYGGALVIAQKKGWMEKQTPEANAITADKAVSWTKVAYMFGIGKIDAEAVGEYVADKAVTTLTTIAERFINPTTIGMGLNKCIDVVSKVFPCAQTLKAGVPAVSEYLSEKANAVVQKGMPVVRKVVKSVVTTTVGTVQKVATTVTSAVKSVGSTIASWFGF